MMIDQNVNLNAHEIGIILSALQNLTISEERMIAKEYGSTAALFNKLYTLFEKMDRSSLNLKNDVVPSF
jgi:hypothetical protein